MTKLSTIVGGLMRDLAQSHAISDAYTLEAFDAYRRDTMLSHLPVPRLSIREAQITLRFAVDAVQDAKAGLDSDDLRALWLDAMRTRVIPRVLTDLGRFDNERVVTAFDRRLEEAEPPAFIEAADLLAEGTEERLVKSTLTFLSAEVAKLPATVRRSIESAAFAPTLERVVREEIPDLRSAARRLEAARQAAEGELEVSITRESLGTLADHQVSELTLTLTLEDLQSGRPPGAGE
ncbi:MAG: hypothetical protein AB7I38_01105 [Dehalococcoidia bacterium]